MNNNSETQSTPQESEESLLVESSKQKAKNTVPTIYPEVDLINRTLP